MFIRGDDNSFCYTFIFFYLFKFDIPWKNDDEFYKTFLIPLFRKIDEETNCNVAINISPKMYDAVIKKYNVRLCDHKVDLRQQLGKQYKTKSQDYIYVWGKVFGSIVKKDWKFLDFALLL